MGETLWQEIRRNPDDDGARLVYADWLQQTDDPENHARGALIHAQLALEAQPTSAKDQRAPHEAQVRAVMQRWRRRWLRPIQVGRRWTFRRGFLDGTALLATDFARHSRNIFEHAPLARTFRFPEASNEMIECVENPDFARVVHADFRSMCHCGFCHIENELPHLFASPYATNLRTLVLADCRVDDERAEKLAHSPVLPNLVALDLSKNRITEIGARALASALSPTARIDLRKNEISRATAKALRAQLGTRIAL